MKLIRGRRLIAVGTVAVAVAVAIALASQAPGSGRHSAAGATRPEGAGRAGAVISPRPPRSGGVLVTVARSGPGRPLPAGFVGLSLEFKAVAAYTGPTSNPVLERLIAGLAPGQAPVLRIGGDSTDWTWWPVRGSRRPGGVTYALTPAWLRSTRALAQAIGARLIVGVNLEADRPALAAAEGRALLAGLGRDHVQALEIGNEPSVYSALPWYHTHAGRPVLGRPQSYDFGAFEREFSAFARVLPPVPLAGPTEGGPLSLAQLGQFVAANLTLGVVTLHRYPLERCFVPRNSPSYGTIPNLLSERASHGIAAGLGGYTALTHRWGLPFRIDEINSVACGGKEGVSDTFASALWALDTLFELDRAGVDGVNFHMFPAARYALFTVHRDAGRWLATVRPEYYGALMFAQAAPPGARLVPLNGGSPAGFKRWATLAPNGRLRVVLINKSLTWRRVVVLELRVASGVARIQRLQAPSAASPAGVTIGGQSFGSQTATGELTGPAQTELLAPRAGRYVVTVPRASAALITIPG